MDNSAYMPNQLQPPPNMVVFSQAGGFEALRMQRPFVNPQVTDITKDWPIGTGSPFSYAGLQMLQLQHIQQFHHFPPFSAFKPPPGPSAFAPPGKCLKIETGSTTVSSGLPSISSLSSMSNMFSPTLTTSVSGGPGGPELAPQSPAGSTSRSPPGSGTGPGVGSIAPNRGTPPEEEDRDGNATPSSENTERSTPEEGRPYRRKKKIDSSCCPVCGLTVRPQELEQHFVHELDKLFKLTSVTPRPRPRSALPPGAQDHPHSSLLHAPSASDGTPLGRWETFKRVKANRQGRIRLKNRKRKHDEPACPVCNERLSGTPEELNQHVERCLNKHNGNSTGPNVNIDDEEVDVEGDSETFEEYEWAGQRRVRATSMLVGGFSAAGLATSSSNRNSTGGCQQEEDDVDLIVDGDETVQFGPPQYSEADIVALRVDGNSREQKERDALREAVISPNALPRTPPDQMRMHVEVKPEPGCTTPSGQSNEIDENSPSASPKKEVEVPVIEALRGRIKELEAETRGQPFKCLICMEPFKNPVTSVCCWHVHCEQCWLHTLGAKKLCPQCNMITSPGDLRRIYM
ncbi:E3 ubiquitin-protein ligase Rnf220-like isoform X2 [Belonocnema kinseyi]|uniref:E3 ubiquitin-protein ligase Rnf220-like isoform X2 n=1 Tax=Belonocnema kinseyi TaxID=2817044 RepID=UPI00143CD08D|nr:E3 ubiquitin-protein ligase Rnf220-like isoform X2 [Belonocnema kinseyi]